MSIRSTFPTMMAAVLTAAACASAPRAGDADRVVVFRADSTPQCAFEELGELSTSLQMRGSREDAERRLSQLLASIAEKRGAHGIMNISVEAPERLPFTASGGRRPAAADLPEVTWSGKAQAILFTDPECRR
jgi:hypothetical protein